MNEATTRHRLSAYIARAKAVGRADLAERLRTADLAERRRVLSLLRYVERKQLAEDAAINAQAAGVMLRPTKPYRTNRKG
jgi:predicted ArsR family transcriptional regulator